MIFFLPFKHLRLRTQCPRRRGYKDNFESALAGSSYEGATFQAAVLNKNVRPDISTKENLFEFM